MLRVAPSPFRQRQPVQPITKALHKYGCLLLPMPEQLAQEIIAWAQAIPDNDLGLGGRELEPHITLKYGFTDDSLEAIQILRALLVRHGPITVQLREVSLFKNNEDGDVLKIDVDSQELHELNAAISSLVHTEDKYPTYQPHVTIAYLKPAIAEQYLAGTFPFIGKTIILDRAKYACADGTSVDISLSFMGGDGLRTAPPKVLPAYYSKGEGEPCEQGETAAQSGCVPASGEGHKKPSEQEPKETVSEEHPLSEGKVKVQDTGSHVNVHYRVKRDMDIPGVGLVPGAISHSALAEMSRDKDQFTLLKVHADEDLRGKGVPRAMLAELAKIAIKEGKPVRTTGVFSESGRRMMDKLARDGYAVPLANGDYELNAEKLVEDYSRKEKPESPKVPPSPLKALPPFFKQEWLKLTAEQAARLARNEAIRLGQSTEQVQQVGNVVFEHVHVNTTNRGAIYQRELLRHLNAGKSEEEARRLADLAARGIKDLSYLSETRGGALVPPAKQRSRLGSKVVKKPKLKSLFSCLHKDRAQLSVSGDSYANKSAEERQYAPALATGSSSGHKSTPPGAAEPIVEKVAEQKAQGYPARFRDPPLTPRVKSVFSYFVKEYKEGKDKRGRRYCTDNGKRVTCRGGPQKPAPKPSTAQPDKETGRRQTAEEKASEKQRKQQQKEDEKKQKEEAKATAKQQKADAKVTAKKQKEEAKQAAKEQADKAAKEAVSKALDAAREISKDPSKATAQQVRIVGDALLTLKLDELKKLKTELGIKSGASKTAIVEGIKKQAIENVTKSKASEQKQPKQKQPAEKEDNTESIKNELREAIKKRQEENDDDLAVLSMETLARYAKDLNYKELGKVLMEFAQPLSYPVAAHGMMSPVSMKWLRVDDILYQFEGGTDDAMAASLHTQAYFHGRGDLPDTLKAATKRIVFTKQQNKADADWGERYGMDKFVSAATGGDGTVAVYNGNTLSMDTFAHESGHNLASRLWGSTSPPVDSAYGKAQKKEKPVSDYGANSPSEDFAEACMMFSSTFSRRVLENKHPLKYNALVEIFGKPPKDSF